MRFAALCALFAILSLAAPALAGGYDDFCDGEAALTNGNYELAIKLYTRAIRSGELSTEDLASASSGRGSAYLETGRYRRALIEFDAAIRILPDDP